MTEIYNVDKVPENYVDDPRCESGLMTKYLGALSGSEKIYVNIDYVKPGAESVKYHSHSLQEEFFLILKGKGTLRFNGISISISQGDFFQKKKKQNPREESAGNYSENLFKLRPLSQKDRID